MERIKLFHDHFQNFKRYNVPKAQLLIADIPYNIGENAYGSNPMWYIDGDNKNGESKLAKKSFFDTDEKFKIPEFFHFCSKMLKKEPKERGQAPCMIVFCAFDQQWMLIEEAKKYGFMRYINLIFRKNFSAQVLKANMRIVGNAEYALLFYRDKLPKFNNNGKMVFNIMDWKKDTKTKKIHPCLPAGEKVYFNDQWQNIENVKIGDKNKYGTVISKSSHYANKLVEIKIGCKKVIATWNHPFLIKRKDKIYWINAELINSDDYILTTVSVCDTIKPGGRICKKHTKKQKKVISDIYETRKENCDLSILLFGKSIMVKFLWVCKYIIKILTKQTTIFPIYNLLHQLNISGITLVADLSMVNGKSRAKFAENIKNAIMKIGIILGAGSTEKYAKNVLLENQSKQEIFLLKKVGSVKIINQKTKVYNLTIDDIPIIDTQIGISHNTQKPIGLIEEFIRIFTDENDVVIDPVAGSAVTLLAASNLNRMAYGFEIKKNFFTEANDLLKSSVEKYLFV
jgi:site-specific DNA-methyltransferase (adenine-specific)